MLQRDKEGGRERCALRAQPLSAPPVSVAVCSPKWDHGASLAGNPLSPRWRTRGHGFGDGGRFWVALIQSVRGARGTRPTAAQEFLPHPLGVFTFLAWFPKVVLRAGRAAEKIRRLWCVFPPWPRRLPESSAAGGGAAGTRLQKRCPPCRRVWPSAVGSVRQAAPPR